MFYSLHCFQFLTWTLLQMLLYSDLYKNQIIVVGFPQSMFKLLFIILFTSQFQGFFFIFLYIEPDINWQCTKTVHVHVLTCTCLYNDFREKHFDLRVLTAIFPLRKKIFIIFLFITFLQSNFQLYCTCIFLGRFLFYNYNPFFNEN